MRHKLVKQLAQGHTAGTKTEACMIPKPFCYTNMCAMEINMSGIFSFYLSNFSLD